MAAEADLCLLPFRDSEEDCESVALDLMAMPNSLAWPSAWPTNTMAQEYAQRYIDALQKAFPLRLVEPAVFFVNSAKELLGASLGEPSTPTRNAARRAFDIVAEYFDAHALKAKAPMNYSTLCCAKDGVSRGA